MNVSKTMPGVLCGLLAVTLMAAACGNGGGRSGNSDSAGAKGNGPAVSSAPSEKGLELIAASDCTTCHRLQESSTGVTTGPAYSQVADKYSPAADTTIDRLVKKVQTGGTGVWGTVPMTPHPALKEADIRLMVQYILSLKK
ncbi:MAG: c-type cytochrome [Bacteroidota bacterium]|nr:c-type cytochrome [Bacteroidota bacterium]MDP4217781.1 c-type cytochrome [Bacteroidota bacterium]MDP4247388.1 c-type cytochrome [Bacteroidota bacterium]MDP4256351.1 c-type cytochrome [Bacteroidota bacterium]MDP4258158.1 c-type cytochrome [Bacteroidota bacterium]